METALLTLLSYVLGCWITTRIFERRHAAKMEECLQRWTKELDRANATNARLFNDLRNPKS